MREAVAAAWSLRLSSCVDAKRPRSCRLSRRHLGSCLGPFLVKTGHTLHFLVIFESGLVEGPLLVFLASVLSYGQNPPVQLALRGPGHVEVLGWTSAVMSALWARRQRVDDLLIACRERREGARRAPFIDAQAHLRLPRRRSTRRWSVRGWRRGRARLWRRDIFHREVS